MLKDPPRSSRIYPVRRRGQVARLSSRRYYIRYGEGHRTSASEYLQLDLGPGEVTSNFEHYSMRDVRRTSSVDESES